jgi:hypothetical protein
LYELSNGEIDLAAKGENLTESGQFLKNKVAKTPRPSSSKKNRNNNRGKKRY